MRLEHRAAADRPRNLAVEHVERQVDLRQLRAISDPRWDLAAQPILRERERPQTVALFKEHRGEVAAQLVRREP